MCLFVLTNFSLGAGDEGATTAKPPEKTVEAKAKEAPKGVKDMTKEELVKGIVQTFSHSRNLLGVIPGIEEVKDEKGAVSHVYKATDGKVTKLEDLPKETLEGIFLKVRNEMVRINTEQTMKQMKEIKRIQDMERQRKALMNTRPAGTTATYKQPSLPKTYTAPKVYVPKSVPKVPSTRTNAIAR